jgi:hypothetical protein
MSELALEAYREARDAYLSGHPEPQEINLFCSQCKAQPGQPCIGMGRHFHLARSDSQLRAHDQLMRTAFSAGDAAYNIEARGCSCAG